MNADLSGEDSRWLLVCGFGGFRVRNGQMTSKP
jgi:hypothetical protein